MRIFFFIAPQKQWNFSSYFSYDLFSNTRRIVLESAISNEKVSDGMTLCDKCCRHETLDNSLLKLFIPSHWRIVRAHHVLSIYHTIKKRFFLSFCLRREWKWWISMSWVGKYRLGTFNKKIKNKNSWKLNVGAMKIKLLLFIWKIYGINLFLWSLILKKDVEPVLG